jgi:two-component sensor histidine kinase
MRDLFALLAINASIIATLVLLYGILAGSRHRMNRLLHDNLYLLLFAGSALLAMAVPWQVTPGLILDVRLVILILATYYAGPSVGLASALIVAMVRLYLGGVGAVSGVFLAFASVLITLIFMKILGSRGWKDVAILVFSCTVISVVFGFLAFLLAPMLTLDRGMIGIAALGTALLQVLIVWMGAWLMTTQLLSVRLLLKLDANRNRYFHLFDYAPIPLWEEDFSELVEYIEEHRSEIVPNNVAALIEKSWDLFAKIRILRVNRAAVELAGAESAEELKTRISETATAEFSHAIVQQLFAIRNRKRFFMTSTGIRNFRGEKQYVVIQWSVLPGAEEDYSRVMVSIIDSTTVVRQARDLRENLERKELLIREIHHRVRNSLSLAYSILGLQIDEHDDAELNDIIRGSMNRIQAIALIHTRLYQNREILAMNIHSYISDLIDVLSTQTDASSVRVRMECPEAVMHIDQVLPLGIIINELVTNSLKHAFPPEHQGKREIHIKLELAGATVRFTYSDSGIGMDPAEFSAEASSSLGVNLLFSIGQQLGGEPRYFRDGGTRVSLEFPLMDVD